MKGRKPTPTAKAHIEGRHLHEPSRYRRQGEPKGLPPLGTAPAWMTKEQAKIWSLFAVEVPWLNASHRALVEGATILRARVIAERDVPVPVLSALRSCLSEMGATPSAATRVAWSGEDEADPDDALFRRAH